jgi:hypothetical protein
MQIILEADEAGSLMAVITSYAIDKSGIAQDGKQAIRKWRTAHAIGTPAMASLAEEMNAALGGFIDEKTNRVKRAKGRYERKKERA